MMYMLSGTSAPWTGQIIVTEEEPAGTKSHFHTSHILHKTQRHEFASVSDAPLLCYIVLYLLTIRGRRSRQTP